jgi:hypothetical protein
MSFHSARLAMMGRFDDVVLLLVVAFLFPLTILLLGAPIALLVRAVVEIVHRL